MNITIIVMIVLSVAVGLVILLIWWARQQTSKLKDGTYND